jgi:Tfp pilus assembly protein PilF
MSATDAPALIMARSKYLRRFGASIRGAYLTLVLACVAASISHAPSVIARNHAAQRKTAPTQTKTTVTQTKTAAVQTDDAQTPEARIAEGAAALERNDVRTARVSFQHALELDHDNVAAHTYLGVLADREGNLQEAERHFAAAAIAAPLSPQARNNHGAILLRLGRLQQAAAQFEVSLRLDQNQPSPLVNLARIRFESATPEGLRQARELFERAYAIAPDADIARALVITSLRLGDKQSATRYFGDYTTRLDSSSELDERVAGPRARAELGGALLIAGLLEESIRELSAATTADPSNVEAILLLGRAHLSRKDVRAAGRLLEGAVARGLEDARIYAALADVYEAGGYVEHAIPSMRLAIARDPKNESYRVRYGLLLIDTKAPAAAVIRLEEALKEFPASPRLWLALGIAQLNTGKNDDAQKSFTRTLELDPKSVPALAYLGTTSAERGQYAEAVAFYERAIAAGSDLAVPYYLAADALLKQSEVDAPRVEKLLARAVELDPDFASAHLALARLYVRAERWTEAAAQFERVIQLDRQSAEAHYQLGRVYVRLKRTADAQRELETFKQLSEAQKEKRETDRRDLLRRLADVRF